MLPLLPFFAGLLAGGVAVKLLRSEFTRNGLEVAKETLRHASTVTLTAVDKPSGAKQKQTKVKKAAPANATGDVAMPAKQSARKKSGSTTATTKPRRKAIQETIS